MRGAVALILSLSAAAAADRRPPERAEKLFDDGRRYIAAGEFALACTAFEQSDLAEPAVGTELNIGLCYEKWGKTAKAYAAFVVAEDRAKQRHDGRAAVARKHLDALDAKLGRLQIELAGAYAGASVVLDGRELRADELAEQLVDPGDHVVQVEVDGARPESVHVEPGQRARVRVEPPAAPAVPAADPGPAPASPAKPHHSARGVIGGGLALAGAVSVGVASYVAVRASDRYKAAAAMCPAGVCTTADAYRTTQDARQRAHQMTYVAAGGIAVAAIGVYLLVTGHDDAEHTTVAPVIGDHAVGVAIGGAL